MIDLLVTGLRLGLPADEDDLFEKLASREVGLRNILVHEYGRVNDVLVFETVRTRLEDFAAFKREILTFLRQR